MKSALKALLFSVTIPLIYGCSAPREPITPQDLDALPSVSIPTEEDLIKENQESQPEENPEEAAHHPISLPSLAEYQPNGNALTLGTVLADNTAYTRYTITYSSDDLTISGIMNMPKGEGPFPIVILNHGYIDPAVYTNGRGLKREQDYLARQGYAVIHPDYRNHAFSSKVEDNHMNLRLGYTKDVINAVSAIKNSDIPNLNTAQVGMMGHSMGGGITLNILVSHPELVQAAMLYAPVSAEYRDNFDRWTRNNSDHATQILDEYGTFAENPDFWDSISPINFLSEIKASISLHHGTLDESVPIAWSEKLNDALIETNKSIEYFVYEGEKHELIPQWQPMMERTTAFFDSQLKDNIGA